MTWDHKNEVRNPKPLGVSTHFYGGDKVNTSPRSSPILGEEGGKL